MRRSVAIPLALAAVAVACGKKRGAAGDGALDTSHRPTVTEQGQHIVFPPDSPGLKQFMTASVKQGETVVTLSAPARVVASIAASVSGPERVVLFESPDATSTWSQYRQGRVAVDRTTKALERVRDMYKNLGATAREVTEAETDAATARANAAEHESRMRALGFNPSDLDAVTGSTAWLMADVPEAELHNVPRGGRVAVRFTSFPERDVAGRAEAVGDIIDPVTRTVRVRVAVPNPERRILPGMFARVTFGDPRHAVRVLPAAAIVTVEERSYVFVRTSPNEFVRREVSLQRAGADSVIVLLGLADNDQIVTTGALLLKGLSFGY
ncbi:MAG TPA: efflux RND transporter periplasmic adaptor subunit [Gemmatimonadaceae bacterium]|nr:efflux RND transporter periplasmic adaptor subunit [Gemmatimonadaceae bacterium]